MLIFGVCLKVTCNFVSHWTFGYWIFFTYRQRLNLLVAKLLERIPDLSFAEQFCCTKQHDVEFRVQQQPIAFVLGPFERNLGRSVFRQSCYKAQSDVGSQFQQLWCFGQGAIIEDGNHFRPLRIRPFWLDCVGQRTKKHHELFPHHHRLPHVYLKQIFVMQIRGYFGWFNLLRSICPLWYRPASYEKA